MRAFKSYRHLGFVVYSLVEFFYKREVTVAVDLFAEISGAIGILNELVVDIKLGISDLKLVIICFYENRRS